ncbi:hypothetical protein SAMN05216404_11527 [Nitrosospira multiformis]|uniref:DUF4258 domain-containing protein n=1 Tax=Nitrosospira multiformis TaxID=1231 RepID=A0A1H8N511_9PROT|nr:hypothetical protein [Nitrosospira multiformis]SEO24684.1 hypothetical protein SAMN05216404_11527 [Nitrosospira multiformis]
MNTRHAEIRAQQRGIPPMVEQLLDLYGQEEYDGRGAITLYLNKNSIRNMERDLGRRAVSRLAEWFDAYKVKTTDGRTITIGHRTRRLRRK